MSGENNNQQASAERTNLSEVNDNLSHVLIFCAYFATLTASAHWINPGKITTDYLGLYLVVVGVCGLVFGPLLERPFRSALLNISIPVCFSLIIAGGTVGFISWPSRIGVASAVAAIAAFTWSFVQYRRFVTAGRSLALSKNGKPADNLKPKIEMPPAPCTPKFIHRAKRVYDDADKLRKWRVKFVFEHSSEISSDRIELRNQAACVVYYGLWYRTAGVNILTVVHLKCRHDKACLALGSVDGPTSADDGDGLVRATTVVTTNTAGNQFDCSVSMSCALNAASGPQVSSPAGLPISFSWPGAIWSPVNSLGSDTGLCN